MNPRWKLVPHFLLRRAGFPFQLLDQVSSPLTSAAARTVVDATEVEESARRRLLKELFPAEVRRLAEAKDRAALKTLSKWRRKVGRSTSTEIPAGPWSPALAAAAKQRAEAAATRLTASQALDTAAKDELAKVRNTLRGLLADATSRDALFLLSPGFLETGEGKLVKPPSFEPDSHERAFERRLYAFLQRLASKNETTSFFGPLAYGVVAEGPTPFSFGPELAAGVSRRQAFAAFWAVTTIAKAAATDPGVREALPPRRVAISRADGTKGFGPDGAAVELTPEAAALFPLLDGLQALPALTQRAGLSETQARAGLQWLEKKGFARRDLEPLSTLGDALSDLRQRLPQVDAASKWRAAIDELQGILEQFATAPLARRKELQADAEKKFSALTSTDARRAGGKMYADRTVLYEDCLGDLLPLTMSVVEAQRLEHAVTPLLDLGGTFGALRRRAVVTLATEVLKKLGGTARFLPFAEALDGEVAKGALDPLLTPSREWLTRFEALLASKAKGHISHLTAADLEPFIDRAGAGRFASPDVMLQKVPGESPRFVIGEVHPYVYAWGSQNQFAPDPKALFGAFEKDLSPWGGPSQLATVLRRRKHKGLVSHVFPGVFIEISGRGSDLPEKTMAVADLEVRTGPNGPELFGPRGRLTLYAGEDDHAHLRVFAPSPCEMPPFRLGKVTPRIEVDDAILQRARWIVEPDEVRPVTMAGSPAKLALAVATLVKKLGLPRFVFASSPSEPKPLCIDLQAFHAQQLLKKLWEAGKVTLVEMLPSPEGLWLQRKAGAFTSELRLAMIREP